MSRTPASEMTPSVLFKDAFKHILELAELVFDGYRNDKEKADSWIHCDIEFLEKRLDQEIKEYNKSFGSKLEESIDVLNFALMIAMRQLLEKHNLVLWPYIAIKKSYEEIRDDYLKKGTESEEDEEVKTWENHDQLEREFVESLEEDEEE